MASILENDKFKRIRELDDVEAAGFVDESKRRFQSSKKFQRLLKLDPQGAQEVLSDIYGAAEGLQQMSDRLTREVSSAQNTLLIEQQRNRAAQAGLATSEQELERLQGERDDLDAPFDTEAQQERRTPIERALAGESFDPIAAIGEGINEIILEPFAVLGQGLRKGAEALGIADIDVPALSAQTGIPQASPGQFPGLEPPLPSFNIGEGAQAAGDIISAVAPFGAVRRFIPKPRKVEVPPSVAPTAAPPVCSRASC